MPLNPEADEVYRQHGTALLTYPISAEALAKQLGVSRWIVRLARDYAREHGPPPTVSEPAAIHLVLPDAHAKAGISHERFSWVGYVLKGLYEEARQRGCPLRLVSVGDIADYSSLCYYEKGKAASWGKTYPVDVAAHRDAVELLRASAGLEAWAYTDKHWCVGNHEHRATRYMQDNPELQGALLEPWQVMAEAGFTNHEFLAWAILDGVGYSHYMQNPKSTTPVSSVNMGRALLLKGHKSVVVGHSHMYDSYREANAFGVDIRTLNCGCYFEHYEEYAGLQSCEKWWRGLFVLRNVRDGDYALQELRMKDLREKYA